MKKYCFVLLATMIAVLSAYAQDKPIRFTVEVSTDSILMDNYFEVKFILENANGKNFEAPQFDNFNIVSGPNFSSSYSMANGEITQSMTITYYLEPKEVGAFYILPASVETGGKTLETSPLRVLVVPNPDGIKQAPKRQSRQLFDMFDSFDFGNDFFFNAPRMTPKEQPKKEEKPVEKKKKTTRI